MQTVLGTPGFAAMHDVLRAEKEGNLVGCINCESRESKRERRLPTLFRAFSHVRIIRHPSARPPPNNSRIEKLQRHNQSQRQTRIMPFSLPKPVLHNEVGASRSDSVGARIAGVCKYCTYIKSRQPAGEAASKEKTTEGKYNYFMHDLPMQDILRWLTPF